MPLVSSWGSASVSGTCWFITRCICQSSSNFLSMDLVRTSRKMIRIMDRMIHPAIIAIMVCFILAIRFLRLR